MSDLVERLRNWTEVYPEEAGEAEGSLYGKAADEIERLRFALEWAAVQFANHNFPAFSHQCRVYAEGE